MTKEEIFSKLQTILVDKLGVDADDVKLSAHLHDELGMDSLDDVEVIIECESVFGISIPDSKIEGKVFTVQDAVDVLDEIIN